MPLSCKTTTTQALCNALKPYFKELHQLPYNRFNRENTVWWLSPGSDVPAYRFPKFALLPPDADTPDQLFAGIYIEKGVSEDYAKAVKYSKHHILGADWAWHNLMQEMARADRMDSSISQVQSATKGHLELRIYASMQIKDAAEALSPKGEMLAFNVGETLTVKATEHPSKLLASLAGVTTLPELARGLSKLDKADFIWIDFVLGVPLTMKDEGFEYDVEDIAKKIMGPFEWLVQ